VAGTAIRSDAAAHAGPMAGVPRATAHLLINDQDDDGYAGRPPAAGFGTAQPCGSRIRHEDERNTSCHFDENLLYLQVASSPSATEIANLQLLLCCSCTVRRSAISCSCGGGVKGAGGACGVGLVGRSFRTD
jgi:hypothetical protein